MPDLKYYLVVVRNRERFIVLAKDAKDAIDYLFNNHLEKLNKTYIKENIYVGFTMNRLYTKDELKARSLGSLSNEKGRIICL